MTEFWKGVGVGTVFGFFLFPAFWCLINWIDGKIPDRTRFPWGPR